MNKLEKHFINCFIAGIVAILPIFGFILFVGFIESKISSSGLKDFNIYFPGLGLIVCIIFVYLCGLFVTTFAGKWLWKKFDNFIDCLPVLGQIYRTIKDLLGYDTSKEKVFKNAVLIPSAFGPGEELGLVTDSITDSEGKKKFVVFIPSSPTPTTGRLVYVDEEKVKILNIKASEVFSTLIAMGKTHHIKNALSDNYKD